MVERLSNDRYAELLVTAYMGVVEFEELEPDQQAETVQRTVAAIDFMAAQGHIIVPISMIPVH